MNFFFIVSTLTALAAVSSYVNWRYDRLPTTIGVMMVALVASLALILAAPYASGFREQATTLASHIDFNAVVLQGILAFLLFASAIHVKLDELGRVAGHFIARHRQHACAHLHYRRRDLVGPPLASRLELLVLPIQRTWMADGRCPLAIPIVLSARLLSVAAIVGSLGRLAAQAKGTTTVPTWSGLRRGISVAMALSVPANESCGLVLLSPTWWLCSRSLSRA